MPGVEEGRRAVGGKLARTRDSIIAATMGLALAGQAAPVVRDIADASGVSARTVFQHFTDTEHLYLEVLGRVLLGLVSGIPEPAAGGLLAERIGIVVEHRAARFEQWLAIWPFVDTLQRRSSAALDQVQRLYTVGRVRLAQWLDPELARLPERERDHVLNAAAALLTPEGWIVLRQRLGLTPEEARDVWQAHVTRLVGGRPA